MSEPQKVKRFSCPQNFDEAARLSLGRKIVELIKVRTDQGKDINGNNFEGYSSSYKGSLEFRLAGKSDNKVNLQLSGDMLVALDVIDSGPGYISIGFEDGSPENDKAAWAEASDNGPSRKFLGLPDNELEILIEETTIEQFGSASIESLVNSQDIETKVVGPKTGTVSKQLVDNILKGLGFDDAEDSEN